MLKAAVISGIALVCVCLVCGFSSSSTTVDAVASSSHLPLTSSHPPASAAARATTPPARSRGPVVGSGYAMPVVSHNNQCAVSDGTTEIIFFSSTNEVGGACDAQLRIHGWERGNERAAPFQTELLFCYLRNHEATVVASVFGLDVAGHARMGRAVCRALTASRYWVVAQASPVP